MMKTFFVFAPILFVSAASAALEPSAVREVLTKKTETYLKEGIFAGGDREIRSGLVKGIRRAANGGFERVVIDLDSVGAPYYQVAVEPAQRRILVTLFGSLRLGIDAKKIVAAFKKSPVVSQVEFFPRVEEDAWIFALHLKTAVPVEVFELGAPTRIVFDLKTAPARPVATAPRPKAIPAATVVEEGDMGNSASSHSEEIPE